MLITKAHGKENYNKNHCYQYDIRINNFEQDLKEAGLTQSAVDTLKVSDFEFKYLDKSDVNTCSIIKAFIIRHEWLGKMPHRPTHRFIATYQGIIAGVIIMATPNAFSNLLGKENRDKEKLISRGACISWSPKNLGSALVMFSIRWMVKNTPYRFFTAYSDTKARELGTIYQACNFTYLGQSSGARFEYFDPRNPDKGWFCDRLFRKTTSYKLYAQELGIDWDKTWSYRDKILWTKIPAEIKAALIQASKAHQARCHRRGLAPKHKYLYVLGASKRETKELKHKFNGLNPNLVNLDYPKSRVSKIEEFLKRPLTKRPSPCWPLSMDQIPSKKLYSIKEVSIMYGISQWLIYHHIKSDPTFPCVNVGIKKRFLIQLERFDKWLSIRSQMQTNKGHNLPSVSELLEVMA